VRIDWEKIPKIDVVYLSHSHLDHIDPYFLTELYKHQHPVLLLAETLAYLIPVFKKYLPTSIEIQLQRHLEITRWKEEVELTGLNYCTDSIGNEEDVMTLFISHRNTAAYFEIDTIPPMIYEEQELLVSLLTAKKYDAIAYVASSNELE
jgi:L-ascorbate metabolism protein UlaG (beta-lactamase superfamily)